MSKWIYVSAIVAAVAVVAAVVVILVYRRKARRLLHSLDNMLDLAIDGKFTEHTFDESALSAVESKMVRYLSSHALTSDKLRQEKDKINTLISDISHQTKTPIANVLLYAQLLREHDLPGDCAECTEALFVQAGKLDFLISSLVKASRLETGIISVNVKRGKVQTLLDTAVESIHLKAESKHIAIHVEATDGTADYDPKWTAEALYNILDNAVKYAPRESVIDIRTKPYELFFRIDIADRGIGIAEEEQGKIFTRFYRSPSAADQEGVGIGLYLAREIIQSGGGYIKVSSSPGKGSVFSIFLPTENR